MSLLASELAAPSVAVWLGIVEEAWLAGMATWKLSGMWAEYPGWDGAVVAIEPAIAVLLEDEEKIPVVDKSWSDHTSIQALYEQK